MNTYRISANKLERSNQNRSWDIRKVLLGCGIVSSILYVVTLFLGATRWEGYSSFSQTISELFAIGAPSRPFVVPYLVVYDLLLYAFGVGVWESAEKKRVLRVAAALIIAKEVFGLVATVYSPIHLRGVDGTLTDNLHGILTAVGVFLCMFPAMGFAAAAFGKRFRFYSIGTMLIFVVCGIMGFLYIPLIAANQPTPWLGVWERINSFSYMLWIMVLAGTLYRNQPSSPGDGK
jgi:hypothetical protein